jgi:hypothetical protein
MQGRKVDPFIFRRTTNLKFSSDSKVPKQFLFGTVFLSIEIYLTTEIIRI